MATGNNPLVDFLRQFGQGAANTLGATSQMSLLGQQGYETQQAQAAESQRQTAQLAQQLALHNTMTPYEKAALAQSAQSGSNAQNLDLINQLQKPGVGRAKLGDPNAVSLAGVPLSISPAAKPATPFTYTPTDSDVASHPWLAQYQGEGKGISMPPASFPAFFKDLGLDQQAGNNLGNALQYENTLKGQIGSLLDPNDPSDQRMRPAYEFQVHDALHPFDGAKPDFKRAASVIDDIRKDKESLGLKGKELALGQSDAAINFAARKSGAEKTASNAADEAQSRSLIPDSAFGAMYRRIKLGQLPLEQAANQVGRMDKVTRDRWVGFLGKMGDSAGSDDLPVPVNGEAQKKLMAISPVIDELNDMQQKLAPYQNDSTPFRLLPSRAAYAVGMGDQNSGLISEMEMMRIRGAAQAAGGAPALKILEQAQLHTPSAWSSSGMQSYGQIQNMKDYLVNQEHYLMKYGNKYGVVQTDAQASKQAPNNANRTVGVKTPATTAPGTRGEWNIVNGQMVFTPSK